MVTRLAGGEARIQIPLCQDLEGGLMAPHSQRAEVGNHKLQQSPQKPADVCRGRRWKERERERNLRETMCLVGLPWWLSGQESA